MASFLRLLIVLASLCTARGALAAAPTAATSGATDIQSTSAVLNGSGNPNGEATAGWFRYSTTSPGTCNDTFGVRVPATSGTDLGSGTASVAYSITTTGLTAGNTYYFCAITSNATGKAYGTVLSFTIPAAPVVNTTAATSVTSSSATLNGSANPTAATTTGWFRYASTNPGSCNDTFGTRAPSSAGTTLGSGTSAVTYSRSITGLLPGTTYYYCAIANNAYGTTYGSIISFTAPPTAPSTNTASATEITGASATLNGSANPNGDATTSWFRYGTTYPGSCSETFGTAVPESGGSALGGGNTAVLFSQAITGLANGTTYYYCAVASNSQGTSYGSVYSFTTPSAPSVTTTVASSVANTTAYLEGTANPNYAATTGWFRYSTTNPGTCDDTFGTRVPTTAGTNLGSGGYATSYYQSLTGLTLGTTYYFCAIAQNSYGKSYGAVVSFTTTALAQPSVTTLAATSVTSSSATMNGSANPNYVATTGWFRYDVTNPGTCNDVFGTRVPTTAGTGTSLGSGSAAVPYSRAVTTVLTPATTYYYCAIASNAYGTSYGSVMSFTTPAAAPAATTGSATSVTATSATINGTGTPRGAATTGWFRYSTTYASTCSDTFGTRVPASGGADLGSGQAAIAFSEALSGLTQGTTYYYCAVVSNSVGTTYGYVYSFTTPTAPTVTTDAASGISNTTAYLNGTGNPKLAATTGWFRFSTTSGTCSDSFGTRIPATGGADLGSSSYGVAFYQSATGLTAGTTYYYCAVAQNSLGTTYGSVVSFTTTALAQPSVLTLAATSVTSTSATMNGSANPNSVATTGWFRYDTTNPGTCSDAFGTRVPSTTGTSLGSGTAAVPYSRATTTTLVPATTYYYCAIASNSYGTSFGSVMSFTTPAAMPTASTGSATNVTGSTATLNGSGVPRGAAATGWFQYGTTYASSCSETFGTRVPASGGADLGSGNTSVAFSQNLTDLALGTTYYYCAIVSNSVGTTYSSVYSFTTPTAPIMTTSAATSITNTTAYLYGTVNPKLAGGTAWFRYSTTNPGTCDDSFGTRAPSTTNFTAYDYASSYYDVVSGLTLGTTYYYCAIGENAYGKSFGTVVSFTTTALQAPTTTTLAASTLSSSSAYLNGSAVPNGVASTGWFRYSTTNPTTCDDTFGTRWPTTAGTGTSLGSGTTAYPYSRSLTGLAPATTYYYCAIASNSYGTTFGAVQSFTTLAAAPGATTSSATSVTASSAVLNGSGVAGGAASTAWFRYGTVYASACSDTFGTRLPTTGGTDLGSGNTAVTFSQALADLTQGTTYYYCAVVSNSVGTTYGGVYSFTTPTRPTATTLAASGIGNTTAYINGTGIPNLAATTGYFRFSTATGTCSDTFGTRVPAASGTDLGSGSYGVSFSQYLTDLTLGTTYYYCAVATNSLGTSYGAVMSFTTTALAQPSVSTQPATSVTATAATLNGSANPNSVATTGWFRWATVNPGTCNDTFGTRLPTTAGTGTSLGSGTTAVAYSRAVATTLTPATTYYYCAIASNAYGTSFGQVQSFTTPAAAPYATTGSATSVTGTSATLEGTGTPRGAAATAWFRYSTTYASSCSDTFGTPVPATGGADLGSGQTAVAYSQALTGLSQGTTYYYCAVVSNSVGTTYGGVYSLTTPTAPIATTLAASSVDNSSAYLYANGNPKLGASTGYFRFSTSSGTCSDSWGTRVPASGGTNLGTVNYDVSYYQAATGLLPKTTYYYCAVVTNAYGTSYGAVVSFTTLDKPLTTTAAASGITATSATMSGSANPNGSAAIGWFRYDVTSPGTCNDSFGTRAPTTVGTGTSLGSGTADVAFSRATSTLFPGTTYYYCAIASNAYGTSFGAVQSFTTLAREPIVTTVAASGIASTAATLNGSATPRGANTTGYFLYGTVNPGTCTATFGTRAPSSGGAALGAGNSAVAYSQTLDALTPNTTYYFCAAAENSMGTIYGGVYSFTTPATPTVNTLAATPITSTTATLNANATPNGSATTAWFRYSATNPVTCNDTFGTRTPASGGTALGGGSTTVAFSQALTGLLPGTTYYFCGIASNTFGTTLGPILSFTTPVNEGAPSVLSLAATGIASTTATLNGSANPISDATNAWFRYSTTSPTACNDTFGIRVPTSGGTALGAGNVALPYSQALTGLTPSTTYYFCAIAQNSKGTAVGSVLTFTTLASDPTAPTVVTSAASSVTLSSATLNGAANPNGAATNAWFRYDTTQPVSCNDSFGTRLPASGEQALGSGTSSVTYSLSLTSLTANTTYYYCAIAQNSVGMSYGSVLSFTTPSALSVASLPATSVTSTAATLNGSANPSGVATSGWFRYSTSNPTTCDDTFGTRLPASGGADLGSGSSAVPYSQALTGLTPNTTYYYCAVASAGGGTAFGLVLSFTTPSAPSVATLAASSVTSTSASLDGSANPNGAATSAWFRYDTTSPAACDDTFGTRLPASGGSALGSGTSSAPYSQALTGLTPNTTYYFCAIAQNATGTAFGSVLSFTTPSAPTVTSIAASAVTTTGATLNGSANPNGASSTGWFRYATTSPTSCNDTFGVRAPASGGTSLGSGSGALPYSQAITALSPNTTYYFCAIAQNATGLAYGEVLSFKTPSAPSVTTLAASDVTSTGATLNGSANPNGVDASGWFRYATTSPGTCNDTFGTRAPSSGVSSLGIGSSSVPFAQALTGLTPNTTYYFCAIAQNVTATGFGSVLSFTTPSAPTVTTVAASSVTGTDATLNGSANPNGAATNGWFRYATTSPGSCNDSFGTRLPSSGGTALGTGSSAATFSQALSGLTANATYYFCAIAQNATGVAYGEVLSFTTSTTATSPSVTTVAASALTTTGATLNGAANPNGAATSGWFRYDTFNPGGCNDTFGARVPASGGTALGSGNSAATYSQALSGLTANTTYYFCAVAQNATGTSFGAVLSFTTGQAACTLDSQCSSTQYCSAGTCVDRQVNGASCAGNNQCANGFCVDGVCCDAACAGQCEACDVTGSVGTCTPVTGAPHGNRPTCDGEGETCGGTCDGSITTSCTYPGDSVECRAPSCTGDVAVLVAYCDGLGACPPEQTQDCAPFTCGVTSCAGDCQTDGDCGTGTWCSAGVCTPLLTDGTACSLSSQCASDSCADFVCCNTACAGQCEACDVQGLEGVCSPVSGAPHGSRPACASDGSECGGSCDGSNTAGCTYPDVAVECRAASCAQGIATLAAGCDGAGACPEAQTTDCGASGCADAICAGGCTLDTDCADGDWCSAGVCTRKGTRGTPCSAGTQCLSNACVDGFCCNSNCTGQCAACDVAGLEGTCSPVTGQPHGARTACVGEGSTCGGACDGVTLSRCTYPGAEVECRAPTCAAGVATLAAACDGAGACPEREEQTCAPFVCDGTACGGDCTTEAECETGSWCSAGVCVVLLGNGEACSNDEQCTSEHCVDGVCCDTACGGQCAACDVAGSEGTCTAVTGQPHGARPACAGDGSSCAGACDGVDRARCSFPGSDVVCSPAACRAGVATEASTCNGAGTCPEPVSTQCVSTCSGTACATGCNADTDCSDGDVCVAGTCEPAPAGGGSSDKKGCGCRVGQPEQGGWGSVLVLAGLLLLRQRRRRRRAAA